MRKITITLPLHVEDRLRKFRERNDIEESVAIMRLISDALNHEEENLKMKKMMEDFKRVCDSIRI